MRSRLRFFLLIGTVATFVDYWVFVLLANDPIWRADAIALLAAASVAYGLNRLITFSGDLTVRFVNNPGLFAVTVLLAGSVDLLVLQILDNVGIDRAVSKVPAIALAGALRWIFYRYVLFTKVSKVLAQRVDRPEATEPLRLSVVLPAYNEAERIVDTVASVREALVGSIDELDYEIVVVDDGSKDDTVNQARSTNVKVLEQPANRGKGAAVRAGVLASTGRAVVFTDSDLSYPPKLILEVLAEIEQGWDMVVGSRRHQHTNTLVKAGRLRELGGRGVNALTHLVLLGHFRDTQCGLKGFRGDIGKTMFERCQIDGFAFDVELFLMAEQDELSLKEIAVSIENRETSSVRLVADTLNLVRDLFKIRRWAGRKIYAPNEAQLEVISARTSSDV